MVFECVECGRGFETKHGLNVHSGKAHSGDGLPGEVVECSNCGEGIYKSPSALEQSTGTFFCDKRCQGEYLDETVIIECAWCGEPVKKQACHVSSFDHSFCDRKCMARWRVENKEPHNRKLVINECRTCGSEIETNPSHDKQFCDRDCYHEWRRGKYLGDPKHAPVELFECECERCGVGFEVYPSRSDTARFCSYACLNEWKASRTGQDHPLWKAGTGWYRHVRSALGPVGWHTLRARHLGDECERCGEAEGRIHLHHIVPVLAGGTNGEWNFMTLCGSCHTSVERFTESIPEIDPLLVE